LVGGGVRVPAIQTKLEEIVGADKIAKHVNADEAAVLGAAFYAALISPSFRTRKTVIKDISPFSIMMDSVSASDKGNLLIYCLN
jgi:hypoxia up-regulated 1